MKRAVEGKHLQQQQQQDAEVSSHSSGENTNDGFPSAMLKAQTTKSKA